MRINIKNAHEKNLKHIDLEIPRNKMTVITGLSGSGKTTLLKDTIYIESQRQYLESMSFQGIPKPKVDSIQNLSPAILIDQEDRNGNPRSTLGTQTDMYTDLRMIFEKLHERKCPHCGKIVAAHEAIEETEKTDDQYTVYMFCPHCEFRMKKLTRSAFSFNTKEGACGTCKGIGKALVIGDSLYDKTKSILEGGVVIWQKSYADYQQKSYFGLLEHLGIETPDNLPLADFTSLQIELLKNGIHSKELDPETKRNLPTKVFEGRFEGVETKIWQKIAEHKGVPTNMDAYIHEATCPDCHGEKLSELSRSVSVFGKRLPELGELDLQMLREWVQELKQKQPEAAEFVKDYLFDIETKVERIAKVGLDYLSLDRPYASLSGGEAQRIKLAAILDSEMTELLILLDEPTVGLHPDDTTGLLEMIAQIQARNNTIIAIEHDETFMKHADHIIEIGPKSGKNGGEVVASGSFESLSKLTSSLLFQSSSNEYRQTSRARNTASTAVTLNGASSHNLKEVSVAFPVGCLSVVTGVSGSGKSTLLFHELAKNELSDSEHVTWHHKFKDLVTITQKKPARNKRSIIATYLNLFDEIRKLFAKEAKKQDLPFSAGDFSFNSGKGRCENCQGLGVVENNQLFFENFESPCPVCHGSRYKAEVLQVEVSGHTIKSVLDLSIQEAIQFFDSNKLNSTALKLLSKTSLDYISIGQTTDSLSGGEMQRLNLTRKISLKQGTDQLFILDEPTTGLHKLDVFHFMELIRELIDLGNSFIFIEHNLDVISQADFIVELGPDGGKNGGHLVFSGPIEEFLKAKTKTTKYLSK